jgi:hypothetical protein
MTSVSEREDFPSVKESTIYKYRRESGANLRKRKNCKISHDSEIGFEYLDRERERESREERESMWPWIKARRKESAEFDFLFR